MIILSINQTSSFTKASIPKNLYIKYADNHTLSLQDITYSQTLPSPNSETVTIRYEPKLLAKIFRNSNI